MNIIKRNGTEVVFEAEKISNAIKKANASVDKDNRATNAEIQEITASITQTCEELTHAPHVEDIQDLVEYELMTHGRFRLAKNYITYRYTRALVRRYNTTDEKILTLKPIWRLS